jgi:hypothetical protein
LQVCQFEHPPALEPVQRSLLAPALLLVWALILVWRELSGALALTRQEWKTYEKVQWLASRTANQNRIQAVVDHYQIRCDEPVRRRCHSMLKEFHSTTPQHRLMQWQYWCE